MAEAGSLGVAASAQLSLIAPGRDINQDAVGRWAPELASERARAGALYVVADGVGPRDAGQLASKTALDTTLATYRRTFDGNPRASLERALRAASQAILALTAEDAARSGMASTCTAALIYASRLYIGHVGDSRAYLVRAGRARRLTQDHTWAAEQIAQQSLTPEQAAAHPLGSAPTRLLGTDPELAVDLLEEPLRDGDVVVLCTDGVSATLSDADIARLVQGEDARGAADRLARTARTAGSSDDISVTVLMVEPVAQPSALSATVPVAQPAPLPAEGLPGRLGSLTILGGVGLAALGLILMVGLWLYQLTFNERIYPGVHALGADLGGRRADDAMRAIETQFAEYARTPLTLEVAGQQFYYSTGELGVRLDTAATIEGAMRIGRSGNPLRAIAEQGRSLLAGRDTPLVFQVDESRMEAALTPLARRVETDAGAPQDAALLIDATGAIRVQPSRPGRTLDRGASATLIRDRLSVLGAGTLRLPTLEVPPSIVEADVAEPRATAERILAQPLLVTAGGELLQLEKAQLASVLSVRKAVIDGRSRVTLNLLEGELARMLMSLAERVARAPVHARFGWSPGGVSVIVPGQDGHELDVADAARSIEQQVLGGAGPVSLPLRTVRALGQADLPALGLRELIVDAALPLNGLDPATRTALESLSQELHGRLVMPGQRFSLLDAVRGARVEQGLEPATGLMSSALLQTIFWAGYAVDERHAPRSWTVRAGAPPRGQPGIDAMIDSSSGADLRFTNNSSHALLIQVGVDLNNLVMALYGTTPPWTVQMGEPIVTGLTPPDGEPERREVPQLPPDQEIWLQDRSDGFSVSIQRVVNEPGSTSRPLNLTSAYQAQRGVLGVGTRAAE